MPRSIKKTASAKKVGYAVVGLDYIAQKAVLPAFGNAGANSRLVALVSDDDRKLKTLGEKYHVSERYIYEDYEECLKNPEVQAVYIALPNHLHAEYTIRSAQAGKHVLCEKPLAVTMDECEEMIDVCKENKIKLMTAYRLHFEKTNLGAIEIVRSGKIGEPRIFNSLFTMQVTDEDNIRLKKETGGGTLYDIGIYCINAVRNLFQQEPTEVFAWTSTNGERRFQDVEEMTGAVLRFPQGKLATIACSFGAADVSSYEVIGTKGTLRIHPAYDYAERLQQKLVIEGTTKKRSFARRDQFGPELLYFSDCILRNRDPEPSGVEGLADVRIIRALYESAESSRPIELDEFDRKRRPRAGQEIRRPPVEEPELVHAKAPSED